MARRTCRHCGAVLASDNEDEWCSPCLIWRECYDPRSDPHFLLALLSLFQAHQGERIEPIVEMGLEPRHARWVNNAVRMLRRRGHEIHSAGERCKGYKYVGQVEIRHICRSRGGRPG